MNFRDMTPEQRREMARAGGRRAHARGTARRWTTEEAVAASRKSALMRRAVKLADAANRIAVEAITFDQAHGLSLRCPGTLAEFDVPLPFDGPEAA